MAEFKTGDRVRIKDSAPHGWVGREGCLAAPWGDRGWAVKVDGCEGEPGLYEDEMELIEEGTLLTPRSELLRQAEALVNGDREDTYGTPAESLGRIAGLWSVVLGQEIKPAQVALLLASLKVARLSVGLDHRDGWVDLAGYAAIGAEVANAQ